MLNRPLGNCKLEIEIPGIFFRAGSLQRQNAELLLHSAERWGKSKNYFFKKFLRDGCEEIFFQNHRLGAHDRRDRLVGHPARASRSSARSFAGRR